MKLIKKFENFMEEVKVDTNEEKRLERQHKLERIVGKVDCDMSDWEDYVPVKDEPVKETKYDPNTFGYEPVKETVKEEPVDCDDFFSTGDLSSGTTSAEEQLEEMLSAFRSRYDIKNRPTRTEPKIEREKVIIRESVIVENGFTKIANFLTMTSIKKWFSEMFKSKPKVEKPVVVKESFLHNIKMWFYK